MRWERQGWDGMVVRTPFYSKSPWDGTGFALCTGANRVESGKIPECRDCWAVEDEERPSGFPTGWRS